MAIQPDENPQARLGLALRTSLFLLAAGVVAVYLILAPAVAGHARRALLSQQLSSQQTLACMVAGRLDAQVRSGGDALAAFNELGQLSTVQFGSGFGGFTLVGPDGDIIAQLGGSEPQPPTGLQTLQVRDTYTSGSLPLEEYARLTRPTAGLLYSAAGESQHQSVAVCRIAANNWGLLVHRGTREIEELAGTLRTYVLVAFLCLAVLILAFALALYYALAGVFNRAVQSAESISTASQAFQESLGVMRGPLHNITGLTDLLCMAADGEERERYAGEIKAEVGRLILMFKKSEF
jgi:hypothetical protein